MVKTAWLPSSCGVTFSRAKTQNASIRVVLPRANFSDITSAAKIRNALFVRL